MTLSASDFRAFHSAVHCGKEPFAWQQRLLEHIVLRRAWPRILDLPTGSGKTTCIDVALFALALDAANNVEDRWCPRRIAMIVDRRIVVDQVAERGRELLKALTTSEEDIVIEVAKRLRSLARSGDEPLGVFTLRGGMPRDDGWARTPDQPLVIASTVDQIGSRMLIQGYGISQGMKPVHAGLIANDTLLLLDEVHLSEPFRQTLDQLATLRSRCSESSVKNRFIYTFLSATPGTGETTPFSLLDDEKKLNSELGPRLHASKPSRLVEVEDRNLLEQECVDLAKDLLLRHRTIAIIVNRVASASAIAKKLSDLLCENATVTLLTGRMRPLDRDDVLRELRPTVRTGRNRSMDGQKRVIVGTQCIEAGADFDFDALITEAASLDSLRQRFGRLDRLGSYGHAEGIIVWDNCAKLKEELKRRGGKPSDADDDPIYGKAIVETMKWLKLQQKERPKKFKNELKQLKDKSKKLAGAAKQDIEAKIARLQLVDFGVLEINAPEGEELKKLLVDKPNAPILLPTYLDLWMQTSPAPSQLPDVSLWLHGPNSGPADVQVVWRADLSVDVLELGDVELATSIVAAVRPSSLEAISLPFMTARAWLANRPIQDLGDTEGANIDKSDEPEQSGLRALRWRGDDSDIVSCGSLRPGDTIVVPVCYGGIRNGCFDASSTHPVQDRAEQAELLARARPVLRLHPEVLKNLGIILPLDDANESRKTLGRLASNTDLNTWKQLWAGKLAKGEGSFVVPADVPWTVIRAKRVPLTVLRNLLQPEDSLEAGVEVTTDGDDSFCAGRAVPLADHCGNVEELAREFATRCGLGKWLIEHLALAGWLHDIGKADRRFQIMLRGGSEIDYFKDETPWAKSAMPSGSRAARKLARDKSGYPSDGHYHAVQSVAMLTGKETLLIERLSSICNTADADLDLVLYLIASHHGECRPFAPVVDDDRSRTISLAGHFSPNFGSIDFLEAPSNSLLHQINSPLADRFWTLVNKFGWFELCWLESILRLADHRASEMEQTFK